MSDKEEIQKKFKEMALKRFNAETTIAKIKNNDLEIKRLGRLFEKTKKQKYANRINLLVNRNETYLKMAKEVMNARSESSD